MACASCGRGIPQSTTPTPYTPPQPGNAWVVVSVDETEPGMIRRFGSDESAARAYAATFGGQVEQRY
jgi:hypothetical protein